MKVDVLTVADVTIKKWRWWSDWVDVAVFDYSSRPYLLQMKISRTNAKKFRPVCMTGYWYRQSTTGAIGNLTQMNSEA